ncbi:uncharacterized protein FOMMEDRAFT_21660, partial [Fomitiporia mediterranea MF3/22]|uniref:uncharacterized protein n=1 Tax=Fomitiporia mediterranea (strain MF3/22) TaxID=694068 RepID=UPI0004407684
PGRRCGQKSHCEPFFACVSEYAGEGGLQSKHSEADIRGGQTQGAESNLPGHCSFLQAKPPDPSTCDHSRTRGSRTDLLFGEREWAVYWSSEGNRSHD